MSTKPKKKEQIDTHPSKVQNPYEKLKRSPGKFDQRVFKEQELFGSNINRYYHRLYSTQQHVQMMSIDKKIAETQRRSSELRAETEDYKYLRALRAALLKEKERRDTGEKIYIPPTPPPQKPIRKVKSSPVKKRVKTKQPAPEASEEDQEKKSTTPVLVTEAAAIDKVAVTNEPPALPQLTVVKDEPIYSRTGSSLSSTSESTVIVRKKPEKKRPVSPNRLAKLEKMSFEIMTQTMPIGKLKRIMPGEELPVHEKWPILSNYRKKKVMPGVLQEKQRLEADMEDLHQKINSYFNCDNFPLWQYKYIPKDHPRRYKLLKAIESENIVLPCIPKY